MHFFSSVYAFNLWTLLKDVYLFLSGSIILMYGSNYWSTERRCMNKMVACGISLGTSLFPYCLIGCSIPVRLTGLQHFSEVPSALLPSLFPSQQRRQFNDLGCFNTCSQTQHQKLPFFLKAKSRVTERL